MKKYLFIRLRNWKSSKTETVAVLLQWFWPMMLSCIYHLSSNIQFLLHQPNHNPCIHLWLLHLQQAHTSFVLWDKKDQSFSECFLIWVCEESIEGEQREKEIHKPINFIRFRVLISSPATTSIESLNWT